MSDPQAALNASRVADIPIVTIVRVMNALKTAGYAVVELPEPDEHGHFQAHTDIANKVWGDANPIGDGGRVCTGIPGYEFTYRRPESARSFAAALLAAADAADASKPDPHAGQLWANELQSRQRQVPSDREWS